MKSFSKKLFACVMAVCMLFTMCAGVLSVSAAATAVVAVSDAEIQAGTSGEVTVNVTATDSTIYGAEIYLKLPIGFAIDNAVLDNEVFSLDYQTNTEDSSDVNLTRNHIAKFIISDNAAGAFVGATSFVITLTVSVAEDYAETSGEIVVLNTAGNETFVATLVDNVATAIATTGDNGIVTVAPAAECQHTNYTVLEAVAATCEATGLTEGKRCSDCGVIFEEQTVTEALGHKWDDGVIDPDSTCTSEGVILYTCQNDPSHTYTEAISLKDHTPVAYEEVAATCEEVGYTGGTYCSVCNAVITPRTELEALGHAYGTPVDNGDGTHTATCANNPEHTVTAAHEYVDGTCACGATEVVEPDVDPNLVFQGASLGIGDNSLEMTFRIRKTVLELYNEVKVVIIPQKYDASLNLIDPPVEKVIGSAELENANTSGSIKKYVYTDFELYELGLNFDYMLRAYDENGNLVAQSEVYGTSAAEFLKSLYTTTSSETMKTLITDTLIVGEEAIKRMKATYPNASIANAASVIEGFDTSKATASVGTPNSIDEIDCKDDEYTFGGATATYPHALRRSAAVGKAPYLSYRIYNKGGTALDISKLSVRVSFDKYDGTQFNQTFTSADGVITHTGTGNWTNVTLSCIPMPDSNKDITIEISYDGDIKTVMTYSIETYLNSVSQDSDLYDLAVALIKLGVGFRNQKASS